MPPDELSRLVDLARDGDADALAQLVRTYEPRLMRMVELRLDARLRRRLDASDVVQEGLLEAVRRVAEWRRQSAMPFQVWLRLVCAQSLAAAQRRHLGAEKRDAQNEVPLPSPAGISAANAADAFAASITSPSQAAQREELRAGVLAALEQLDALDREVVALRHFEGLSNEEVAAELAITPEAASKRFLRALVRLRPALDVFTGESP
jgi:RNA polymerase sigma-70 factor (ECF subfamily)